MVDELEKVLSSEDGDALPEIPTTELGKDLPETPIEKQENEDKENIIP